MSKNEVAVALVEDLVEAVVCTDFVEFSQTSTFEDEGFMTNDAGFVLRMKDGSVFNVTVTQTAPAVGQVW